MKAYEFFGNYYFNSKRESFEKCICSLFEVDDIKAIAKTKITRKEFSKNGRRKLFWTLLLTRYERIFKKYKRRPKNSQIKKLFLFCLSLYSTKGGIKELTRLIEGDLLSLNQKIALLDLMKTEVHFEGKEYFLLEVFNRDSLSKAKLIKEEFEGFSFLIEETTPVISIREIKSLNGSKKKELIYRIMEKNWKEAKSLKISEREALYLELIVEYGKKNKKKNLFSVLKRNQMSLSEIDKIGINKEKQGQTLMEVHNKVKGKILKENAKLRKDFKFLKKSGDKVYLKIAFGKMKVD
ncbi:MAG: hypothetical protein ACPGJV_09625 [Bacteriovoracaceae bacterium]